MTKARILADYVAGGTTAAEFDYLDGLTSAAVGINDTQTLTNKTLTSPAFTGTPTGVHLARNGELIVERASTTTVDIDADILTLYDSSNVGVILGTAGIASSINLTLDEVNDTSGTGSNGVLGLDTGNFANSTWYHLYVIYNGSAVSCVASLAQNWISTTNDGSAGTTKGVDKTNISGYTYGKYVGAVYRNSSGNFDPFWQKGNDVICNNTLFSSTVFTTSWVERDLSAYVPQTASKVRGEIRGVKTSGTSINISISANAGSGQGLDSQICYHYGQTSHSSLQVAGPFNVRMLTPQKVYVKTIYTITSNDSYMAGWSYNNIV